MEKNFIKKDDLEEIISDLTNAVLKNATKIAMTLDVVRYSTEDNLIVKIQRRSDWKTVKTMEYVIIDNVDDCYDVVGSTVNEVLSMMDDNESVEVEAASV